MSNAKNTLVKLAKHVIRYYPEASLKDIEAIPLNDLSSGEYRVDLNYSGVRPDNIYIKMDGFFYTSSYKDYHLLPALDPVVSGLQDFIVKKGEEVAHLGRGIYNLGFDTLNDRDKAIFQVMISVLKFGMDKIEEKSKNSALF
jgi:hypothetical protein